MDFLVFVEQPYQGNGLEVDDYAATDVKVRCSDGSTEVLSPNGVDVGEWGNFTSCPSDSFVCGARAHFEQQVGTGHDDTSLNRLQLACCKIRTGMTFSLTPNFGRIVKKIGHFSPFIFSRWYAFWLFPDELSFFYMQMH